LLNDQLDGINMSPFKFSIHGYEFGIRELHKLEKQCSVMLTGAPHVGSGWLFNLLLIGIVQGGSARRAGEGCFQAASPQLEAAATTMQVPNARMG